MGVSRGGDNLQGDSGKDPFRRQITNAGSWEFNNNTGKLGRQRLMLKDKKRNASIHANKRKLTIANGRTQKAMGQ